MVILCNQSLDDYSQGFLKYPLFTAHWILSKTTKKCSSFKLFKCFIQLFLLAFLSNLNFALLDLEASLAALVPFLIALLCTCSVFFSRSLSSFSSFFFFLTMFLAMLSKPDWVLLAFLLSLVSCFFSRPSSRISYSFSKRPSSRMCDIPTPIPLLKSLRLFLESRYLLASIPSAAPVKKPNSTTPRGNLFNKAT